jgi:hypothetical protein
MLNLRYQPAQRNKYPSTLDVVRDFDPGNGASLPS